MYICICNALSEKRVRAAAAASNGSTAAVYRALDCRPQCGRCIPMIRDIVHEVCAPPAAELPFPVG